MLKYLKNIIKNIIFLSKNSLIEQERELIYEVLKKTEDFYKYEILDGKIEGKDILKILNYEDTIDLLLNEPKSFCRFGDGEIDLIQGKSLPFQKYDKKLADMLLEILQSKAETCYVGINYNYFHSTKQMNDFNRKFYLLDAKRYRDFLIENCNKENTYIAAAFNQVYVFMEHFDCDSYYMNIMELFKNKELVIFSGNGILNGLKYDVFKCAKSKEYVEGPAKNAYSEYESLMEKARSYPKSKYLCFILGPASKVMVHQLSKEGYTAWDIGHMAKDYDMYMKKIERNNENIKKFYQPD